MKYILIIAFFITTLFASYYENGLKAYEYAKGMEEVQDWTISENQYDSDPNQVNLLISLMGSGIDTSYKKALWYFKKGVDNQDKKSQYFLGFMYEHAKGVEKNIIEAKKYYKLSAEQGYTKAQNALGEIYLQDKTYNKAINYFNKAAKKGDSEAQNSLGKIYEYEKKDYKKALEFYTKSANQNNSDAQLNLALMYKDAKGVEQDHKEAMRLFSLSAKAQNADAQYYRGLMYFHGNGVEQNKNSAFRLWLIASKLGSREAHDALDELCTQSPWACVQRAREY